MNRWVARTNIDDFRRKLAEEKDLNKQRILRELIAKEEQKLQEDQFDEI